MVVHAVAHFAVHELFGQRSGSAAGIYKIGPNGFPIRCRHGGVHQAAANAAPAPSHFWIEKHPLEQAGLAFSGVPVGNPSYLQVRVTVSQRSQGSLQTSKGAGLVFGVAVVVVPTLLGLVKPAVSGKRPVVGPTAGGLAHPRQRAKVIAHVGVDVVAQGELLRARGGDQVSVAAHQAVVQPAASNQIRGLQRVRPHHGIGQAVVREGLTALELFKIAPSANRKKVGVDAGGRIQTVVPLQLVVRLPVPIDLVGVGVRVVRSVAGGAQILRVVFTHVVPRNVGLYARRIPAVFGFRDAVPCLLGAFLPVGVKESETARPAGGRGCAVPPNSVEHGAVQVHAGPVHVPVGALVGYSSGKGEVFVPSCPRALPQISTAVAQRPGTRSNKRFLSFAGRRSRLQRYRSAKSTGSHGGSTHAALDLHAGQGRRQIRGVDPKHAVRFRIVQRHAVERYVDPCLVRPAQTKVGVAHARSRVRRNHRVGHILEHKR